MNELVGKNGSLEQILKYNIKIEGHFISWDHIKKFFVTDHEHKIRLATNLLPSEAVHTAEFVQQMDKLFDCFNSIRRYHFKKVLRGIGSDSCHMGFIGGKLLNT